MTNVKTPPDFDGEKFAAKFSVQPEDFRIDGDRLICPTLPDLKASDIADCVTDWEEYYTSHAARGIRKDRHAHDAENKHAKVKDSL